MPEWASSVAPFSRMRKVSLAREASSNSDRRRVISSSPPEFDTFDRCTRLLIPAVAGRASGIAIEAPATATTQAAPLRRSHAAAMRDGR